MIELVVNGQARAIEPGVVLDLLRAYGLEEKMVVVEIDGEIVPKEAWAATPLRSGIAVELVHFVGGG